VFIGVCRLELVLSGNRSLKGKRRVSRSLGDRARLRFRLSVAEVEALESLQKLILGAAYVSNDPVHARQVLQRFVRWVESTALGELRASQIDVLRPGLSEAPLVREEGDCDGATESSSGQ